MDLLTTRWLGRLAKKVKYISAYESDVDFTVCDQRVFVTVRVGLDFVPKGRTAHIRARLDIVECVTRRRRQHQETAYRVPACSRTAIASANALDLSATTFVLNFCELHCREPEFKGARKLRPGSWSRIASDQSRASRYSAPRFPP
jgi:hypothetical protein